MLLRLLLIAFVLFLILGILGFVTWHLGTLAVIFLIVAGLFLVSHVFFRRRRH